MDETSIKEGVLECQLRSWRDFARFIAEDLANAPERIFRGQADATWKIESTMDRLEARFPMRPNHWGKVPSEFNRCPAQRDTHLRAFREAVRGKRGANPPSLSEDEWWAMAQHHGLATPILDWTYSPFAALFFAFEEHGYIDRRMKRYVEPKTRAVYSVPFHIIGLDGTEKHPAPAVFTIQREITSRLSSQAGLFMKMPKCTDLESSVRGRFAYDTYSAENLHPRDILTKIIIPSEGRTECLKFLNKMNINRMTLFPDIDGAAAYVNDLWELDFDTALGAIPDVSGKRHAAKPQ